MNPYFKKEDILIRLNFDEGVVLLELLSRFSNNNTLTIEHDSEKRVLWDLECIIEKQIAIEASQMGYEKTVQAARKNVLDPKDSDILLEGRL